MQRGLCLTCGAVWAVEFQENHLAGVANVPDLTYQICYPKCHPVFTSGQLDAGINLSHAGRKTSQDVLWGLMWGLCATVALIARRACRCEQMTKLAERNERLAYGFGRAFNILASPSERPLRIVPDPFGRDHRNARFPLRLRVRPVAKPEVPGGTVDQRRAVLLVRVAMKALRLIARLMSLPLQYGKKLQAVEDGAGVIAARWQGLRRSDRAHRMMDALEGFMAAQDPLLEGLLVSRSQTEIGALLLRAVPFIQASEPALDYLVSLARTKDVREAEALTDRFLAEFKANEDQLMPTDPRQESQAG